MSRRRCQKYLKSQYGVSDQCNDQPRSSHLSAAIPAFIRLVIVILREKSPFFGLDCQKTA